MQTAKKRQKEKRKKKEKITKGNPRAKIKNEIQELGRVETKKIEGIGYERGTKRKEQQDIPLKGSATKGKRECSRNEKKKEERAPKTK